MGFKSGTNFSTLIFLVLIMFGLVTSDINQDKAECTDKLLSLAGCLPFVTGQAKSPPLDCCSGIKDVIDKSKRCLCILIKDHDDPSLGLNINITLAFKLPTDCSTPTNLTQCIDLLHLPPKSHEAKIFEDYQKTLEKSSNSTTVIPPASGTTGKGTSTSDEGKNGGGWGKRAEVLCGILPFVVVSYFFIV